MKAKYHAHRRMPADVSESRRLRRALTERGRDKQRVAARYALYCRLNRCAPWTGGSHLDFLAQVRQSLSAATVAGHARHLRTILREQRQHPAALDLNGIIKLFDEEHCRAKTRRQSPDFRSAKDAFACVGGIPALKMRQAALSILVFGTRRADLEKLVPTNVRVENNPRRVTFDITLSKQRRHVNDRFRVALGERELREVPTRLWNELCQAWGPGFPDVPWDRLTEAVREAAASRRIVSTDGRLFTGGSLRRCFVHSRIEEHTREDGTVDYDAVRLKTGHKKGSTIGAFYSRCL